MSAPPAMPALGGDAALYERDLIEDVIPMIDSKYRTTADRKHRAIVGFSMGGGQAGRFGLRHLETFSQVGIIRAGALRWNPGAVAVDACPTVAHRGVFLAAGDPQERCVRVEMASGRQ